MTGIQDAAAAAERERAEAVLRAQREEIARQRAAVEAVAAAQRAESDRIARIGREQEAVRAELEARQAAVCADEARLGRLAQKVVILKAGLAAVEGLIGQSKGVYGLHLNGDPSPWEELRTGGVYEEWLLEFDAALAVTD